MTKTVVTVLRETLVDWQDKLSGESSLRAIDHLRSIYNSDFADGTVQNALRDRDQKVQECVRDFLDRVKREA